MHQNEINQRLRIALLQQELSVNHIARNAGIPQQVLQRFASGKRENLRLDTAVKLMSVLGFIILDERSIRSMLKKVNSQIEKWDKIRMDYGVNFPKEFNEMITDFQELDRTINVILSGKVL